MKKQKNISGQVLVIVLLVLSIVGIFVVAIASNAQRDIQQTIRDEKYEQYYSLAEQVILEAITTDDLLTYQFNGDGSCLDQGSGGFNCTVTKSSETDSSDNVQIELNVLPESNNIEKLPLKKDQTLTLSLTNFKEDIILSWTGEQVALNLSLDYLDNTSGEYKTVKGIYDGNQSNPVFEGTIDANYNIFNFQEVIEEETSLPLTNNISFTIQSAEDKGKITSMDWNPISLRIKPVITNEESYTEVSIKSQNSSFPSQVSKYTATAYSISNIGPETPTVVLETQIPIHNSPAEFFDYALRSQTEVEKPSETGEDGSEIAGNIFKLDFNEGSGNTITDGINGLVGNAMNFNASNWVNGIKGGSAVYFPYVSSRYITFPDNDLFDGGTEKTYSVWVKRDAQATIQEIMSKGIQDQMSFAIGVCANGNVYVSARSSSSVNNEFSGSSISTGKWHHLVLVVNTALPATEDVALYINGQRQVRGSTPGCVTNITNNLTGIWNNTYDLRIGVRRSNSLPLRGALDNVKIFNKALTQGEILTLYNNEKP